MGSLDRAWAEQMQPEAPVGSAEQPVNKDNKDDQNYTYEEPTVALLSKLYWHLGALDTADDQAIDTFMFINYCDIYLDNFFNEIEWEKIRNNARGFISDEKAGYPVRYKIAQPLKLKEYDPNSKKFEVLDEYKIDGMKKFEIFPKDADRPICNQPKAVELEGYPKALIVELSQPFSLTAIPMDSAKASEYMAVKMEPFNELENAQKSKKTLYYFRDAYIVMKIRMFSYNGLYADPQGSSGLFAQVFAMLEGYEIYSDPQHTDLLYFENFERKKQKDSTNDRLKQQREKMLKGRGGVSEPEAPVNPADKIPPKL
jgi:hypothetical protein